MIAPTLSLFGVPKSDEKRLLTQLVRVRDFMLAHPEWVTLRAIATFAGGSEAGVSARLRDLRKAGFTVERKRAADGRGLHLYRILPRETA